MGPFQPICTVKIIKMGRLKLILKQSDTQRKRKTSEYMIMLRYSHQAKTTYFYTGKSVNKKFWDDKNQQVKRSYIGSTKLNLVLSKFQGQIEDIINSLLMNDVNPTTSIVKDIYTGNRDECKRKKEMYFWDFVEQYKDQAKNRINPNTLRSYNNAFNNLKAFEKYSRSKLNWHSFDSQFYSDFLEYYTGYKGLGNNGFGKIIKVLKTILNDATEKGYNKNRQYKSKSFKALKEEVENIYLDENELETLLKLDLSNDRKLERVRDLFYLGCYTGLRFSDYSRLTSENIINNTIKVKTQKTGTPVIIPLLNEALYILEKYNFKLPKSYSNQKMNQYLKEIGKLAKLDQKIIKHSKSGSTKRQSVLPKHDLICTHTARRSFATNMYKRGIPTIGIMSITGHKTDKSFMKYIKISKEENANMILEKFNNKKSA